MRKPSTKKKGKVEVTYFQRRPRKGFSFSLEYIFNDVRERLKDKINATVTICKLYNNGYFTKIYNIIEAGLRQSSGINHITGEVHFLNLLMRKKTVVLTVLDCGMVHRKKGLAKWFITSLYLTWPVRKSKYVTAISGQTKEEIVKYARCNPDKIVVIPVAINHIYQPFPKAFNAAKPVILHIGTGYNKNLLRLTEALQGISCHLTIVGKLEAEHLATLVKNEIDFSNEYNISNERLLEKYQECDILSFVSTFEGFGMPIVEANAVGRVVITSNLSSMPEVANDAACLVDPYDVKAIRRGMLTLINDETYRDRLLKNGIINKQRFDAQTIADKYFDLYEKM